MAGGLDVLFDRRPTPEWRAFLKAPLEYLTLRLYDIRKNSLQGLLDPPITSEKDLSRLIKVVCLSDTHNHIVPDVPDGDILVHAGDMTEGGTIEQVQKSVDWLDSLPHKHKVAIAGNHEFCLDPNFKDPNIKPAGKDGIRWGTVRYLCNSSTTFDFPEKYRSLKVYGSPNTPKCGSAAFQFPRATNLWENTIPVDTDVLLTHGPSRYHLDLGDGCQFLLKELWKVRPKLHVFGHMHRGYGKEVLLFDKFQKRYEDARTGGIDIWYVLAMVWLYFLDTLLPSGQKNPNSREGQTILVNAAMVRGRKNEKLNKVLVQYI